jgi:hypothetical protein
MCVTKCINIHTFLLCDGAAKLPHCVGNQHGDFWTRPGMNENDLYPKYTNSGSWVSGCAPKGRNMAYGFHSVFLQCYRPTGSLHCGPHADSGYPTQKIPCLCGTQNVIIEFTRAHHWTLSRVSWIQSTPLQRRLGGRRASDPPPPYFLEKYLNLKKRTNISNSNNNLECFLKKHSSAMSILGEWEQIILNGLNVSLRAFLSGTPNPLKKHGGGGHYSKPFPTLYFHPPPKSPNCSLPFR